jgi:hypothetical protein
MERTAPRTEPRAAAMPVARGAPRSRVLPAGRRERGASAPAALARCAVDAWPLVWGAAHDRLAASPGPSGPGQPGAPRVAAAGVDGWVPEAPAEPTGCWGAAVSLWTDRGAACSARSRLVDGPDLRASGPRRCLLGGHQGRVSPCCPGVGGGGDVRPPCWRISPGARVDPGAAGHLHLGSRGPVHAPGLYQPVVSPWGAHQPGWTWARLRYHVWGTAMAPGEV